MVNTFFSPATRTIPLEKSANSLDHVFDVLVRQAWVNGKRDRAAMRVLRSRIPPHIIGRSGPIFNSSNPVRWTVHRAFHFDFLVQKMRFEFVSSIGRHDEAEKDVPFRVRQSYREVLEGA